MENMHENIGKALAPAFLELAQKVQPVVEKIVEWIEKNPQLTVRSLEIAAALAGVIAVIGTLGLILPPIIAGFGLLPAAIGLISLPVLAIIAAIALLGAAVYEVYANWDNAKGAAAQAVLSATRKAVIATPLIPSLKALVARNTGDARWLNIRPPHLRLTDAQTAALFNLFDASGITLAKAA